MSQTPTTPEETNAKPTRTKPISIASELGLNDGETKAFAQMMQDRGWEFHQDLSNGDNNGDFLLAQGSNWNKCVRSKKSKKAAIRDLLEQALIKHTIMFDPFKKESLLRDPLSRGYDAEAEAAKKEATKKKKEAQKKDRSAIGNDGGGGGGSEKNSSPATEDEKVEADPDQDDIELTEEDFEPKNQPEAQEAFDALPPNLQQALRRAGKAGLSIRLTNQALYIARITQDLSQTAQQQAKKVNILLKGVNLKEASTEQINQLVAEIDKLIQLSKIMDKAEQEAAKEAEQPEPEEAPEEAPVDPEVVANAEERNPPAPETIDKATEIPAEIEEEIIVEAPEEDTSLTEDETAPEDLENVDEDATQEGAEDEIEAPEADDVVAEQDPENPDVPVEPDTEDEIDEETPEPEEIKPEEEPEDTITESEEIDEEPPEPEEIKPEEKPKPSLEDDISEEAPVVAEAGDDTDTNTEEKNPALSANITETEVTTELPVPPETLEADAEIDDEQDFSLEPERDTPSKPDASTPAATVVKSSEIQPPAPHMQPLPQNLTPVEVRMKQHNVPYKDALDDTQDDEINDDLKKQLRKAKQAGLEAKIIGDEDTTQQKLTIYKEEIDPKTGKPIAREIFAENFREISDESTVSRGIEKLKKALDAETAKTDEDKENDPDLFEKGSLGDIDPFARKNKEDEKDEEPERQDQEPEEGEEEPKKDEEGANLDIGDDREEDVRKKLRYGQDIELD